MPLVSFDNGYGLGQTTNPTPTYEQVWNWKKHADNVIFIIKSKRNSAKKYLSQDNRSYTQDQLDLETLAFYNGANYHYHAWDSKSKSWVENPNVTCDPKESNKGWDVTKEENKGKSIEDLRKNKKANLFTQGDVMLNTLATHSKSYFFIIFFAFITLPNIAKSSENSSNIVKLDERYTLSFNNKKNKSNDIILIKNNKEVSKISFPIPKGRDPRLVGMNSYGRVLFSQPIKTMKGYAIPYLFSLRTNAGGTQGQCGSGIEVWLKIISIENDSIFITKDELVQSCQHNIYLQESDDGKIENAFKLENGKIIIKWLSHPSNNGDEHFEAIPLN